MPGAGQITAVSYSVCWSPMFELRTASLGSRDEISVITNTIFQWTSVLMTATQLVIILVLLCLAFINSSNAVNLDGEILLAFKSQIIDSDGVLIQWKKEDPDPCGWKGVTCDSRTRRVIYLNLPYHKLRGPISPDIGKLSHLRRLALHDNNFFGNIPPDLGNCTQLRALYLQDNFLSGVIPPEFGKLAELKILYSWDLDQASFTPYYNFMLNHEEDEIVFESLEQKDRQPNRPNKIKEMNT